MRIWIKQKNKTNKNQKTKPKKTKIKEEDGQCSLLPPLSKSYSAYKQFPC